MSVIGHGMWGIGDWTGATDTASLDSIRKSAELGINFYDTAWIYGKGKSEKILAKLIKENLEKKLIIATKVPPKNFKWPLDNTYTLDQTYPADHIIEYTNKSLKNLGVKQIDLLQLHGWDDVWADDHRWQDAVHELKAKGLIKAFGISIDRWEPENAIKAIKTGLIDAVQVIYNIFDQAPEDDLFPICREQNIAVIARVPFDEGTLTGTLTMDSHWPEGDWRNKYFTKQNLTESLERLEEIKKILPDGMSLPELALRFIISNKDVSTVIPGMRSVQNVIANIEAVNKGELDADLIKKLREFRWDRRPYPGAG